MSFIYHNFQENIVNFLGKMASTYINAFMQTLLDVDVNEGSHEQLHLRPYNGCIEFFNRICPWHTVSKIVLNFNSIAQGIPKR